MQAPWRHSILLQSTLAVFVVSCLLGAISIVLTAADASERAHLASTTRLNQLLDTVESTVSVACFVGDERLAAEVAEGLLKNSEVRAVSIDTGHSELARLSRPGSQAGASQPLTRAVHSPFDPKRVVGNIRLVPDAAVIAHGVDEAVRVAAFQLAGQLALVVLAVVGVMLLFIVRPIKAMSDHLHHMDATAGDRLTAPRGHAQSEIGRLANDVNMLAGHLVASLEEERALRLQQEMNEKKYHAIFEHAESGIFITDDTGLLSSWNPAFARLLEIQEYTQQASERHLGELPWENPAQVAELLLDCLYDDAPVAEDQLLRLKEGGRRWLNIILSPIGDKLLQGVVHDVTGLKEAEASAKRQAVTDPLTGLPNRLGLEARLHALEQDYRLGHGGGFALMLVDLDAFRGVNEGLGLPAGDAILRATGKRLSSCVKGHDTVARLAADSFAITLPGVTLGVAADNVSGRILRSLRQPHLIDGSPVNLHASIGIALFPHDGTDIPTLLRDAELALGNAKAAGGNTAVFFDPSLAEAATQRRRLENDLRLAIRNQEFRLFFQPIIDLRANRLAGAEVLIRWDHPGRGLVPPDTFIPIAEQSGLINDIGLWVLDTTCAQLAAWEQAGRNLSLSLNISARQIPSGLPPAALAQALERHGATPIHLALEITEGVLLSDFKKAQAWLKAVHEIGCRIYLDDFGTGYSSLSYLKRFPVDTLKVDKSFVQDMNEQGNDRALVEAIVAMGRSLGLEVVAEGVEAAHQVKLLRQMQCRHAQGYYFSRPVPIEDFDSAAARIVELLARS